MILVLFLVFSVTAVQSAIDTVDHIQDLILKTINEPAPNFESCNENIIRKAVFGDLIEIKRRGYFHWAVFVHDATVIQLNNPDFDKLSITNAFHNFTGQVELRNVIQLAGKDPCRINNKVQEAKRKGLRVLPNSEILKKMKEELKNSATFYNLVTHNCEHFSTKMRFGVAFSSQVDAVKKLISLEQLKEAVAQMFKSAAHSNLIKSARETIANIFAVKV